MRTQSGASSETGHRRALWLRRRALGVGITAAVACLFLLTWSGIALAGVTERVSVSSSEAQAAKAGEGSWHASISADGRYVAFVSPSGNLVANDTNSVQDVFVRDRKLGTTVRVSVTSAGAQANNASDQPSISADGRYVAFVSWATNLVAGDNNGYSDIFVHDCVTGKTSRVSLTSSGLQANGYSFHPAISGNGTCVAFSSPATNMVNGDTNGRYDVFERDMAAGTTIRVSVDSGGGQANDSSCDNEGPAINYDGRYVAFQSWATNLVSGDTNHSQDVFIHDRSTKATARVSLNTGGVELRDASGGPSLSSDGRYVAFWTRSSGLVANDNPFAHDVCVYDRTSKKMTLVSKSSSGVPGNGDSYSDSISRNGRYVAFASSASNLVSGDTNGFDDVFMHDLLTAKTVRASVATSGAQANHASLEPCLSDNGTVVAYGSAASNLVSGDTNGVYDIFATTLGPVPAITGVSPATGLTTGGGKVVIKGSGFSGATAVKFGGTAATAMHVDSSTQITATAPAHAVGVVDVKVTTRLGTSATASADKYTYFARYQENSSLLAYSVAWTNQNSTNYSGGHQRYRSSAGSVTIKFKGTGVMVVCTKGPIYGKLKVTLDGVIQTTRPDLYSSTYLYRRAVFTKTGLASATHVLRLEYSGQKNTLVRGAAIVNLDAVDICGTLIQS